MSDQNPKDIFAEFRAVSQDDWQQQAEKEIAKGGGDSAILGKRSQVYGVKPYYTSNEAIKLDVPSGRKDVSLIEERLSVNSESDTNKILLEKLRHGVNSLSFHVNNNCDFQVLLNDVLLDAIHLNWHFEKDQLNSAIQLETFLSESGIDPELLRGSLANDPLAKVLSNGSWEAKEEEDLLKQVEIFKRLHKVLPNYRLIAVNGSIYHNAGATVATELACILAHANEYMSSMHSKEIPFKDWAGSFQVNLSVGKNYFVEIAKIRALRILWKHLLAGHGEENVSSSFIQAENSLRHMSKVEPQLNILRATTAAMSASIGGADSIYLHPFNELDGKEDELASRIALNLHHLIKEESYLEKTSDPSSGSYLIDNLTNEIADKAWKEFLNIENTGGFLGQIKNGSIQKKIAQEANSEQKDASAGNLTILGVNKHRLEESKTSDKKIKASGNQSPEIEMLTLKRLSEELE